MPKDRLNSAPRPRPMTMREQLRLYRQLRRLNIPTDDVARIVWAVLTDAPQV